MVVYEQFASVYDLFMKDVPYDQWVDYIESIMKRYNIMPEIVLDLGCGTGNITNRLAKKGYDMIGIDNSESMLMVAKEKARNDSLDILYLLQDMTEFELYGTVGAVISICDSINYLLDEEDILKTFQLVNNYLDPKGLFIFDINTEYKYEQILGDNVFAENEENSSYIWENYYDKQSQINDYMVTFFLENENNTYNKYIETHLQKAYSINTIKHLIEKAGLEYIDSFDAFTFNPVTSNSERIYIIAKENGKQNKYNK